MQEIALAGQIQHIAYVGTSQNYHVRLDDGTMVIVFEQSGLQSTPPAIGDPVWLTWPPADTLILAVDAQP